MYQHQLKKWGVSKNLKQKEKDQMMQMIEQGGSSTPGHSLNDDTIDERTLLKLRRHARERRKGLRSETTPQPQTDPESIGEQTPEPLIEEAHISAQQIDSGLGLENLETGTPQFLTAVSSTEYQGFGVGEPSARAEIPQLTRASLKVDSNESARLKLGFPEAQSPSASPGPSTPRCQLMVSTLQELCRLQLTSGPTPASSEAEPLCEALQFWKSVKYGIRLLKIGSPDRAASILNEALQIRADFIVSQPIHAVRELLATLSPANTSAHPEVRAKLLDHLSSTKLAPSHPVAVIINLLIQDDRLLFSQKALSTMLELFTFNFGWTSDMTLEIRRAVITSTRRAKDFDSAGNMARQLLHASQREFGYGSIQARLAALEWSHIYIDQEDYNAAKSLGLSVISQPDSNHNFIGPRFHDSPAVQAMEDIADVHIKLGELVPSLVWLEMAAQDAWDLWKFDVATVHIFDKLDPLLRQCGRTEDADWYKQRLEATSRGNVSRPDEEGQSE